MGMLPHRDSTEVTSPAGGAWWQLPFPLLLRSGRSVGQMRPFVWKPHGYMIVFGKGEDKPREMIVTWFWKWLPISINSCLWILDITAQSWRSTDVLTIMRLCETGAGRGSTGKFSKHGSTGEICTSKTKVHQIHCEWAKLLWAICGRTFWTAGASEWGCDTHCVILVDPNSSRSLFWQRPVEVSGTNSTWRGVGWWCGDWGWVHKKLASAGFGITSLCRLLMFHTVRLCQRYMTAEWGPQQCRSGSWFHHISSKSFAASPEFSP